MGATHISAYISNETNLSVENYVKKSGIKKGFLIEDALLHHLQALKEIPQDVIIPTRIQLSDSSMEQVLDLLEHTPEPTPELIALMRHV